MYVRVGKRRKCHRIAGFHRNRTVVNIKGRILDPSAFKSYCIALHRCIISVFCDTAFLGGGGLVVKVLVADKTGCSSFFLRRRSNHRRCAAAGLCKTQHKDAQLNEQRRNNDNGENQPHGFCPGTVLLGPGGLWVGGERLRGGGRHSTAACALGYGRVGVRRQPLPFQNLAGGLGRVAQLGGGSVLAVGACGVEVLLIIVQRVAARIS